MKKLVDLESLKYYNTKSVKPFQDATVQLAERMTTYEASSGGAIPAYIVGDTMTAGWLSTTEDGEPLTPADKQEYIILTDGEWLRKHVIWMADLKVYRLTGKVSKLNEAHSHYITGDTESDSTLTGTFGAPRTTDAVFRELTITRGMKQLVISGTGSPVINNFVKGSYTYLKFDGEVVYTSPGYDSVAYGTWVVPMPSFTLNLTPEDEGKKVEWCVHRKETRADFTYTINLHITANDIYDDYETDDVIDITEAEIVEAFDTSYGHPAPVNNVYSTEEAAWGVWIDGKTIYRKTFTGKTDSVGKALCQLSDVESYINFEMTINYIQNGNGLKTIVDGNYYTTLENYGTFYTVANGIQIDAFYKNADYQLTAYYTKA